MSGGDIDIRGTRLPRIGQAFPQHRVERLAVTVDVARNRSRGTLDTVSPVSRGRKGAKNKKSNKRSSSTTPQLHVVPEPADEPDVDHMLGDVLALGAEIANAEDPLDAEAAGATLLAAGRFAGADFTPILTEGIVPTLESAASPEALAVLLGVGSVADEPGRSAARAAADRRVASGITAPTWSGELDQPVVPGECYELTDQDEVGSVLACSFRRGGRSHAIYLTVDHLECGAADKVDIIDADDLAGTLGALGAASAKAGVVLDMHTVRPADFRWKVECALDARDVHDNEDADLGDLDLDLDDGFDEHGIAGPDDLDDDSDLDYGEAGYDVMATLVRARMATLPKPTAPKPPHRNDRGDIAPMLAQMLASFGDELPTFGTPTLDLPPKRKKSDGPAPIYQIKVGLRGAKPPIWRRLEISADTSLAALHSVIQAVFDWDSCHMHAFQTPYGEFGVPDAELGHEPEAPVTLEQVAPAERAKIRYLYDFGDDWDHEILVEKLLERRAEVTYPRCTGGRREAPPEDCGGIWGYQELLDVLADPRHPEHEDRLEWLGLDTPEDLDPAAFDKHEITERLLRLR